MKFLSAIFLFFSLPSLLFFTGCRDNAGKSEQQPGALPQPENIVKTEITRGPLAFRIRVSREKIRFDERLAVTLEAEAPEKYSFQFPPFGEGLQNQFGIVDYQTDIPVLSKERLISYKRTYLLEPIVDGEHEIPEITAEFQEQGDSKKKHRLTSSSFKLEVIMPPEEFWRKLDIDDKENMSPAASLHPQQTRKMLLFSGILVATTLLILLIAFAVHRHRKKHQPEMKIPAHIIALQELQQLLDDDLIRQNQLKEFFERISAVLRKYIENRFQLKAPELTTEEFLLQLTTAQTLLKQHQKLLTDFLSFCDIVKFARHQPEEQDIQQTFDACKTFIAATQEAIES